MARRCGNCIHKNVCELYDIVQDPTHAVGCGNFLDTADVAPKTEVAREIFAEIEKIAMHGTTPFGLCLMSIGVASFAELKKKYTEDKNV